MAASRIEIPTTNGVMNCWVARPEGSPSKRLVILYMDALGPRPTLLAMIERLAACGFVAVLPNLYHRFGEVAPFDVATAFSGGAEQARMLSYFQRLSVADALADTAALLAYFDADAETNAPGSVGTLGYCMGGAFALAAAGVFADRVTAAASVHGASLATEALDSPHRLCLRGDARVYAAIAAIDPYFTGAEAARLAGDFYAGGADFTMQVYPRAAHGFAIADTPAFNAEAAEAHWSVVEEFLAA